MNMNTNPADLEIAESKPAVKKAAKGAVKSPDWVVANLAAAEAHNNTPWTTPFITGTPETIGQSAREVKEEMNALPVRIAIYGCVLLFWATAAAVAIGLFA